MLGSNPNPDNTENKNQNKGGNNKMSWQNQQVHCKFQQTIINDSDYYTQGGSALPSNTITTGDNVNKFYDSSKIFLNNGTINIYIYNHYINFYHLDGNTMTPLGSDQLSSNIDTTFNGYAFIVDDDNEEGRIVSCVKDISSGEVTITQLTSSDYLSECYEAIKSIEARDYDGYVDFVKDTKGIFEIHDTLMRLAIGDISQLNTEDKTDIVSAINEVMAKPSGVQSDYNQTDNTALDYIKNKPTLGTAASRNAGVSNGVAELDSNGKVPASQLPSFVDDVVEGYYDSITDRFYEEAEFIHVILPESGKSWCDVSTNKSYRWTGSVYTRVDEGVQLGETDATAYRGDRGKTAYDHSQDSGRVTSSVSSGLYKVAVTAQGHIAGTSSVQKSDITALGIPGSDTTYNVTSKTAPGLAPQLPNETSTTKYLRQDGSWAVPPDNNTTYNFTGSQFNSGSNGVAEHNADSINVNGVYYYTSNGPGTSIGANTNDGAIYAEAHSTSWVAQIAQDYRNGNLFVRGKNNNAWQIWHSIPTGAFIGGAAYGTTSSTTKIKIKINRTEGWMLSFVVTLYQGYRATKVMISGYQYGSNHWHSPQAVMLGDSSYSSLNVYFGYDATNSLWVGFDGGSYTGVSISDVTNGYTQLNDFGGLFTISNVSSLTTLQTTVTIYGVKMWLTN